MFNRQRPNRQGLVTGAAVVVLAASMTTSVVFASSPPDTAADDGTSGVDAAAWEQIVAAANAEGSVMYYSVGDPTMIGRLEQAFEAEYPGIDFEFVRQTPNDLQTTVDAEISTGRGTADVLSTTDTRWLDAHAEAGSIVPLDLPNFATDDFRADWLRQGAYFLDSPTPLSLAWNVDLIPDGLTTAEDLFGEDLKGLIGVPEPVSSDSVDVYRYYEETYGEDFVERLAAQEPRIYATMQDAIQAMAAGEVAALIHSAPAAVEPLKAQGAPVEYLVPENARVLPIWAAVPSSAPHPNAALVLANWILSEDANAARGVYPFMLSTVSTLPDGVHAGDFGLRDVALITPDDVQDFRVLFDSLFR